MAWWIPVIQAVGAIGSALLGNQGVDKAADAQTKANSQAIDLQRGIYTDQVQRSEPWRKSGFNALNMINAWNGLPQVADQAGGPETVGGAGNYDWNAYLQSDPALGNEWQKLQASKKNPFSSPQEYAQWHWQNYGQREGRQLPVVGGGTYNPSAPPSSNPLGASGAPDVWAAIKNNPLYVAATQGFLGIDKPQIEGAYATGGQLMSGAKEKALFDRGTARSYNALSGIYGNLAGEAGVGATTTQQINQDAGQYGSNVGNVLMQNGQVAGKAAEVKNANWMDAAKTAAAGAYKYGQDSGWFS